jgi:integrase
MRGNITRRGKASWRIKFDTGTADKRQYHIETVHGTKRDAEAVLAKRLGELVEGRYVKLTVETVSSYAMHWLAHIAPATRTAVTVARYRSIITAHILPGLGDVPLQALDGARIDRFYAQLRTNGRRFGGGLSSMTLHHVHTLLGQILQSAVKARKLNASPLSDVQTKPKPKRKDVEVLDECEIATLLDHLGDHWLYMPVLVAISTGMRRGEIVALRWRDLDLNNGILQVSRSVEELDGEFRFMEPKTERSRRSINLPASLVEELHQHRKNQSAMRLRLGLGKDANDLVFTSPLGAMLHPNYVTEAFAFEVKRASLKPVRFHALRHSHLSMLLRSGVPVHAVAARAGHARASTTLDSYAHLLGGEDNRAAGVTDAVLRRALKLPA